jgi:hypothetical protein
MSTWVTPTARATQKGCPKSGHRMRRSDLLILGVFD